VSRDRRHTLTAEQWVPLPPDEVFPFFADAHNLEAITPPWLHFRVLTPAPIAMAEGARIRYRLRLHGVPLRWLTRIAVWDPPHRFVDEQLKGPYRRWWHQHTFASRDGGTLASDTVHYELRAPRSLDHALHSLVVERDLERIFDYRRARLAERFAHGTRDHGV
jgi:ligand-binding SRPBCC domain-containing protein